MAKEMINLSQDTSGSIYIYCQAKNRLDLTLLRYMLIP